MSASSQNDVDHGLTYFGKMTASISHDVKNYLAIINENAGLMQDLSMMAGMGKELDPQRVSGMCENISAQIKRADKTIKGMNAFAHSIDRARTNICLLDTMNLAMNLGNRILRSRGIQVDCQAPETLQMTTSPFFFMNLLWLVVEKMAESVSEKVPILLAAAGQEGLIKVTVSCSGQNLDMAVQALRDDGSVSRLLDLLHGRLESEKEDILAIILPESLDQDF